MTLESKRSFITTLLIFSIILFVFLELNNKLVEQSNKIEELQKKVLAYSGNATSCKDIKDLVPNSVSGIYRIEVDGEKLEVRCEMNSASGGWTVFQNRYDGSVNFNRSWTSYEQGFGELDGEFWLGLKNLNKLTKNSVNDLRIDMSTFDGKKKYAEYKEFRVGDASQNYKLLFKNGSYTGDAGNGLAYHTIGMGFSTFDNDNDDYECTNCAAKFGGGGNWWGWCLDQNINGKYGERRQNSSGGEWNHFEHIWWNHFDNNRWLLLKTVRLMIRPAI